MSNMINGTPNLEGLMMKLEGAKAEYKDALARSAYKATYELLDAYQQSGHSFDDAIKAVFDGVTSIILDTCRGQCEQDDEILFMRATIEKNMIEYSES